MVSGQNPSELVCTLALRRLRARRSQRGAAVFIVVMAIVLLTGIGVFAVRTASLVDVAAGYERQSTQTHHLSELAGRAAASDASGIKDIFEMVLNTRNLAPETCLANRRPGSTAPPDYLTCYRIDHTRLTERVSGNVLLVPQTGTGDGSFGPRLGDAEGFSSPLEGQILLEYTDPNHHEMAPGEEVGKQAPLEVTVTAHAQLRPAGAGDRPWCAPQASSMGASVQLLRSHLTILK
jgi:hypothetical protein